MMSFLMISLEMINSSFFSFSYNILVMYMEKIYLKDYNPTAGILINLDSEKMDGALNIPYERLLINHKEILDKSKKYYIYCKGGIRSKKAVNILEFYGYNVVLVYKE